MRIFTTACVAALLFSPPAAAVCTFGFLPQTEHAAGNNPGDLTAGDFNNDGYLDVVVQNRTQMKVSYLRGLPGGGFAAPTDTPTEWAQDDIKAADFNNDGNLDIVLSIPWSNNFTVTPHLEILLGNGAGSFTAVPFTPQQAVYQNPHAIVLGDFNKDGKIDAATTKYDAEWSSMQNVGGFLAQKAEYETGGGIEGGIATGDFDGDGNADIAMVASTQKKVHYFFGVGDGTFTVGAAALHFPHEQREPWDVGSGDFNGDGKDDLAIVTRNPYSSSHGPMKIALSNGAQRSFATPVDSAEITQAPEELHVHDIDGDGRRDLLVAASSVLVMRGLGNGTFAPVESFGSAFALGLAIGDFDRDGGADVVMSMFTSGKVALLLNTCGNVTLNLTSSANPAAQGTPITVTATVVSKPAAAATGTLTLKRGTTTLASGELTGGNSQQATMSDLAQGTYAFTAEYSGDSRYRPATATLQQVVTMPPFGPPPGMNAISFGGPVQLSWVATSGTAHYEVWRNNGAGWVFIGTADIAAFTDNNAPASSALLYRVRAIAPGGTASEFGSADLAVTYAFTDATLTPGATTVKLAHLAELRTATNAARAVAGLGAATWTEPSPSIIRASHVTELRSAIAALRTHLGIAAWTLTDNPLNAGLTVKAVHVEELRGAIR